MTVMSPDPLVGQRVSTFLRYYPAIVRALAWVVALVLVVGLFGRIMTYPLAHDEQIHIPAARLLFQEPLYRVLGYNHLPGLPLLLGSFFFAMGTDHFLQTGRVLIFLSWIATALIIRMIARHHCNDDRIAVIAMLVLAAGTLLGPPGMLVTNNFLPIPFALLGFHLFVMALEDDEPRPFLMFGAGLAMAFAIALKVSYIFLIPPIAVAVLVIPRGMAIGTRLARILLPLLAGAIIGGLPVLMALADDPQSLFAHTVRYFTGGHLAYAQNAPGPKAMSMTEKILVAEDVWLAGSGVLAALLVGTFGWTVAQEKWQDLRRWPILLAASMAVLAAIGAFIPTPAFPQYYEPPIPFLVLLFILLDRQLGQDARARLHPVTTIVAALALAMLIPRLITAVPQAVNPSHWTGNIIHDQGTRLRAMIEEQRLTGKVATLSPIVALEGKLPIYNAFAAGPFVYRVAEYLPAADLRYYTTTSPQQLGRFLDNDPPAAIVTGTEAMLDPAFVDYARSRNYRASRVSDPAFQVFLRPARH